jgi:hypothetical protein
MASQAANCKCPKAPGPGGGVQCAADEIATCDATTGECNCTCDSAKPGRTKAEYEAQIFSKVLHTKVDPAELSSPKYEKYMSSFRKSAGDEGTFSFDKEAGASRRSQVTVGVPDWIEKVLGGKRGVSIGPGALLQNCPNGICNAGDNNGTAINAITNAPNSAAVGVNTGTVTVNSPLNPNKEVMTFDCGGTKHITTTTSFDTASGPEEVAFTEMVGLAKSRDHQELLEQCNKQINMKRDPEWLTPYVFCSYAEFETGNVPKARESLSYYDDRKGPNYEIGVCKQLSDFLHDKLR